MDATPAALKQDDAQGFLEFRDGLRNGGLCGVQRLGGADEAAPLGHFQEAADLTVFYAANRRRCFDIHFDM
jgi:hypothetical protein